MTQNNLNNCPLQIVMVVLSTAAGGIDSKIQSVVMAVCSGLTVGQLWLGVSD
jgi:hypothetical protein